MIERGWRLLFKIINRKGRKGRKKRPTEIGRLTAEALRARSKEFLIK